MKLNDYKIGHYKLWDWLVEHPDESKWDWPGWGEYGSIYNDCFACEYTLEKKAKTCEYCVINNKALSKFKDKEWFNDVQCLTGLFNEWENPVASKEDRVKYAKLIRDLWGGMPKEKGN